MEDKIQVKEKQPLVKPSITFDVAVEMRKMYSIVEDILAKLQKDTIIEDLEDDDGKTIGQRTHIHPQLLSWVKEGRLFTQDMWKMGGGELEQEAEKMRLDLEAKMILKMVGKNRQEIKDAMEEWKKSRSFKEE